MNEPAPPSETAIRGFFARLFSRYRKSAPPDEAQVIEDERLLAPLFAHDAPGIAADYLWQDAIEAGGVAVPQIGPVFDSEADVELNVEAWPENAASPPPSMDQTAPLAQLRLLQDVVFGRDGNEAACIGDGWARPEAVHRWTIGQQSDIELNRPSDGDALLEFDIGAFAHPPSLPHQRLFVEVNGTSVGGLVVKDNRRLGLRVPDAAFAAHGTMRLRFSHPDAASPADYRPVQDKRQLGLCFRRLRVFSVARPVPGRIAGTGGLGLAAVEARTGLPPEHMVARFESLGDNAEFGLIQRQAGAEPLGLLRFAVLGLPPLIKAIESGFDGTGDSAHLTHTAWHDKAGRRIHELRDQASGLRTRAEQVEDGLDDEALILQQARRLKMLRTQLLEDMAAAEKIFVFRRHPSLGELTEAEMLPLLQALNQHGPCTLLFIALADQDHPPGTVVRIIPGLLCGYLDALSPYDGAGPLCLDAWLEICANALALNQGWGRA